MEKIVISKLKSEKGETIGETLVSLLIASLALVMLAGAIASASRVITKSKKAMETYYSYNNIVEEKTGEKPINVSIQDTEGNKINDGFSYNCFINDYFSNKPIVSYSISNS